MYTREYVNGTKIKLKEGSNCVYVIEYSNNRVVLYDSTGENAIEYEDGEPQGTLKYLNVTMKKSDNESEYYDVGLVESCEFSDSYDGNCDVVFPYINFRFSDGHREDIYFCIINLSPYKKTIEYDYYIGRTSGKMSKIEYDIKGQFRTFVNGVTNYILIPNKTNVFVNITDSQYSSEDAYCCIGTRKITNSQISNFSYKEFSPVSEDKDFCDTFDAETYIESLFASINNLNENSSNKDILNSFNSLNSVTNAKGNNIEFNSENGFINGYTNVYSRTSTNNDDTTIIKYSYVGTCLLKKCLPKIEVDIHKFDKNDADYIIDDSNVDRSQNHYSISNGLNILGRKLVLLKDVSAVSTNVYDVPKYVATLSAYIPKILVDEGYALGDNIVKVGSGSNVLNLQSFGDSILTETEQYSLKTETFKVNYDNLEQEKYWCNKVSSTNVINKNETYFLSTHKYDYLDYDAHSININEDNRIVYHIDKG